MSDNFAKWLGHSICAFGWHLFRCVARFFSEPVAVKNESGFDTLQDILNQFDQPKKEKTSQQIVDHYLVLEKMTMLEIEFLQDSPARAFVGMTKIWDENEKDVLKITFVPCVVRPEVLYLGFSRN